MSANFAVHSIDALNGPMRALPGTQVEHGNRTNHLGSNTDAATLEFMTEIQTEPEMLLCGRATNNIREQLLFLLWLLDSNVKQKTLLTVTA